MPTPTPSALDRARRKAYLRLLPLLFLSYVIAYVDRVNVGFAKLNMQKDLDPYGFSEAAFGFGMGVFQSSLTAGFVIGPFLGGILQDVFGFRRTITGGGINCGTGGSACAATGPARVRGPH